MEVSIDATWDAQIEQISTAGGPKTEEGKGMKRWNATRCGIRSPAPVVPGVESKEHWEEHRDGVLDSLSPGGHLGLVLAERVALLQRSSRPPRTQRQAARRPAHAQFPPRIPP